MFSSWSTCIKYSLLLLFWANAETVRGANQTLSLFPDSRGASWGGTYIGMPGELGSIQHHSASLLDGKSYEASLSHTEYFLGDSYDWIAGSYRIDSLTVIAASISRFGSEDIPYLQEGDSIVGDNVPTFSIQDWVSSWALARQWKQIRIGTAIHFLQRDITQTGFGFRADLGADYIWEHFRVGAEIEGISSSFIKWEHGWEKAPPELKIGWGLQYPLPYFYGDIHLAWQSKGLFQKEAKASQALDFKASTDTSQGSAKLAGARAYEDPLQALQVSSVGLEFITEFGVSLRAGLEEIVLWKNYTIGAGFPLFQSLYADYSFSPHPFLGNLHRISLSWSFSRNERHQKANHHQRQQAISQPSSFTQPDSTPSQTTPETIEKRLETKDSSKALPPDSSSTIIEQEPDDIEEVLESNNTKDISSPKESSKNTPSIIQSKQSKQDDVEEILETHNVNNSISEPTNKEPQVIEEVLEPNNTEDIPKTAPSTMQPKQDAYDDAEEVLE